MITEKEFDESVRYYVDKGRKIERDDIKFRAMAKELDYKPIYGKNFGDSLSFTKGNKHIWYCRKGWACADLIDNMYANHRYYEELDEALTKEK